MRVFVEVYPVGVWLTGGRVLLTQATFNQGALTLGDLRINFLAGRVQSSKKLVTSQWKIVEPPKDSRDDEWGANHFTYYF